MAEAHRVTSVRRVKRPASHDVGATDQVGYEAVEARIYQSVVDGVMSQRLRPGTKLPELALCELFGVGRSSVQKALQRLAHDHVVELRPNRGAIIAMPSKLEVGTLFEARRGLEAALLPLVAKHATPDDYQGLRELLYQEHAAIHRVPQTEWAGLASTFHTKLAALSKNPLLIRYLTEVISRCALVVAIFQPPGNAACEHDEHVNVLNFLEQGRVDQAIAEMNKHLCDLESHIHLHEQSNDLSLADMLGIF